MHAVHRLNREAVKQPVLDHGPGTSVALFPGLKNQHGGAVKIARLGQITRRPHQHRRMAIVATAVHQARGRRLPRKIVVFRHGQGVHVGAQADHFSAAPGPARPPVDECDHARSANPGMDFIGPAHFECLLHPRCRVKLFKSQFGMGMQVAPERSDLGVKFCDMGKYATVNAQARGKRRKCSHRHPPMKTRI